MIVIDAHTHLYPCHDMDTFMLAAFHNLSQAANRAGDVDGDRLIILAETGGNDYFSFLRKQAGPASTAWQAERTAEPDSLLIRHCSFPDQKLFIVAGRQLATRENLEVLTLAPSLSIGESQPLDKAIADILAVDDAIAILPWGVGKWLGKRKKILATYLGNNRSPRLFVGDNGCRPALWPKPALLAEREDSIHLPALRVLSGSDPLPLPGEEQRVGGFGSIIHAAVDPQRPAESVRSTLADPQTAISAFGTLQSTIRFVKQQLALRMG